MKLLKDILDAFFALAAFGFMCWALTGCAATRQADPYTAATGAGLAKIQTASKSARWAVEQAQKQSVGDAKVYTGTALHSLDQVDEGTLQAEADNAAAAKFVQSLQKSNDTLSATVKGYDGSWTGGIPRRIWKRIKLAFWIIVGVLAADWVLLTFFSTSPIGRIAGIGWSAIKGVFSFVWGWFSPRGAAVVTTAANQFMS